MIITPDVAIHSLRSEDCPGCKGIKRPKRSFCYQCFSKLPPILKEQLHLPVMSGYEEAFELSLDHLGASPPTMPSSSKGIS